jgi:hypothetical protein
MKECLMKQKGLNLLFERLFSEELSSICPGSIEAYKAMQIG